MKTLLFLAFVLFAAVLVSHAQVPAPPKQGDNEASAKHFVELFTAKDFAFASQFFDETLKTAMPADKSLELWQALNAQFGNFKKQTGTRKEKTGQFEIVYVTSEFEKESIDFKLVFNQAGQITGLFIVPPHAPPAPPAYANPGLFTEKQVMIGAGDWVLPGTLSLPNGKGAFPAVVLVHGSGPHDRDETVGPNKPFRDLAWGLASKGIAVVRYEKRTREHSAKMVAAKTPLTVREETVDDALAAVSLLRQTAGVDPNKIFVLGHSLGGMLAPRIGKADERIAGLIVLAGLARPIEETIPVQMNYLFSLDGNLSDEEKTQLEMLKKQAQEIKNLKPADTASNKFYFGAPAAYYIDLQGYNPTKSAAELKQPILVLQGERDYQVTLADDFRKWKDSLAARKNATFKTYPKLNHLFIEGEGKSVPSEYEKPGHVSEAVVTDIAVWIKSIGKK